MKSSIKKKLRLNKKIIWNLTDLNMQRIRGGVETTLSCDISSQLDQTYCVDISWRAFCDKEVDS